MADNRELDRREMPDEIIAWPFEGSAPGKMALTGGWSARRHYSDGAVRYVRANDEEPKNG